MHQLSVIIVHKLNSFEPHILYLVLKYLTRQFYLGFYLLSTTDNSYELISFMLNQMCSFISIKHFLF